MGKLADKLREIARGGAQPIGFAPMASRAQMPRMIVAAYLDAADGAALAEAIQNGADAVMVPVGPATTDDTLKAASAAGQRAMWGGILVVGGRDEVERLHKAKSDFVVLGSSSINANALLVDGVDKILEIDPSWDDVLLRTVEQLPITAILFRVLGAEDLTIQHILQCQKVVALARKPAFVLVPQSVGAGTLAVLRDAGVSGVVVSPHAVKDFRAAVHDLPPPKRREEHLDATLPGRAAAVSHDHDDEEEDDD